MTKALALSLADEELREETADFQQRLVDGGYPGAQTVCLNISRYITGTIRQAENPQIPWCMNVYDGYDHFPIFRMNIAI